jgi:hypothetical protein
LRVDEVLEGGSVMQANGGFRDPGRIDSVRIAAQALSAPIASSSASIFRTELA